MSLLCGADQKSYFNQIVFTSFPISSSWFCHPCKNTFQCPDSLGSQNLFYFSLLPLILTCACWRSLIFPLFSIFYVISLIHAHVLNKSSAHLNKHYNSFFMGKNFIPEKPERLRLENRKHMSVLCVIDYTLLHPYKCRRQNWSSRLYVIYVCRKRKTVIFVGVWIIIICGGKSNRFTPRVL